MKEIFYDRDVETMPEALGIPVQRIEDIEAEMASVLSRAFGSKDKKKRNTLYVLEEFLKIARTEEERLYCAWQAGRKAEEIKHRESDPFQGLLRAMRGGSYEDTD